MALDGTLEGLRSRVLDSIKGRKLGLGPQGYLQGQLAALEVVTGLTAGTTLIAAAASVALPNYGFSFVGSTLTSGSTGSSGTGGDYTLADPVPGVRKVLYNPSTSPGVVRSTAALFRSTGGAAYTQVTLLGNGVWCEFLGASTAQWVAINSFAYSTGNGTAAPVVFV